MGGRPGDTVLPGTRELVLRLAGQRHHHITQRDPDIGGDELWKPKEPAVPRGGGFLSCEAQSHSARTSWFSTELLM